MPDSLPLEGIRVLDLTTFLSGPYGTQILSDLGARVIKLESLDGDSSRGIPPYFVGDDSAYYLANNRNKESIAIDLKRPEGQRLARELALAADVVIENFRPGVAARLGLDARELRAEKPELVWASISGFGQDGPWRDRPAYDMIVQALSGVMSLTGEPGGPASRLGIPVGDLAAGMFAVIGVLAALVARPVSGTGRLIDVSMLDSQLSMLSYQAVYAMISGMAPGPQSSRHDSIPTYRSFSGSDAREFVVTANTERMWRALCDAVARPDLPEDTRFTTASLRLENKDELWRILEDSFATAPAEVWVDSLTVREVPSALIKTVPEALADARASGRGMVVELDDHLGSSVATMATPITFTDEDPRLHTFPPPLGGNTEAILTEMLGLPADEIAALRESGVVSEGSRGVVE